MQATARQHQTKITRGALQRLVDAVGGRELIEDIYPASPVQRGMLYHSRLDPTSAVYVSSTAWKLIGAFDPCAFAVAWRHLVARHAVFRTAFLGEELDRPMQVVMRDAVLDIASHDLSELPESEATARFAKLQAASRQAPMDFARPPLMRVAIARFAEHDTRVIWTCHHALIDGWSAQLVLSELAEAYAAYARGDTPRFKPALPFRDYIAWLEAQDADVAESFWRSSLAGFEPRNGPVIAAAQPAASHSADREAPYGSLDFALGIDPAAIDTFARAARVTTSAVAAAAWSVLFARHAGDWDSCFGLVLSGRPSEISEIERRIGLFITTLPLRIAIDPAVTVRSLVAEVQARQLELIAHQFSSPVDVKRCSGLPADVALFDTILVLDNYPRDIFETETPGDLPRLEKLNSYERTNYPLTVTVRTRHGLSLQLTYDRSAYADDDALRLAHRFAGLVRAMITDPDAAVGTLTWIEPSHHLGLLDAGRGAPLAQSAFVTMSDRIADRAAQRPHAVAIRGDGVTLSYASLGERVAHIARVYARKGVARGDRIALALPAGADYIVAALGAWRVGAAFVPIDPAAPAARRAAILAEAAPSLVISSPRDLEGSDAARQGPVEILHPQDAAYVMFTSGSTGRPKGVVVSHGALAAFVAAMEDVLALEAPPRAAWLTSPTFDISLLEILLPLATGGEVHLFPNGATEGAAALATAIRAEAIDFVQATPSGWRLLFDAGVVPTDVVALCGGEALPSSLAARLMAEARTVWHLYGPTEATIWSSAQRLTGDEPLSIGAAIPGTELLVLDDRLELVDIGIEGELCIGGAGLALGYLGRPARTAQAFVPHPSRAGERLYRTGDRAVRRDHGTVRYLGRHDGQMKIRGHRIEAGEVEHELLAAGAAAAKVVAAADGGSLIAYVTPATIAPGQLKDSLRTTLPAHMRPARIVPLAEMPLTGNGKIDLRALPAAAMDASVQSERPRSAAEELVAAIWSEVLGVVDIGRNANLFALGGHSLHAARIRARASDAFNGSIAIRLVFDHPTVADFAAACVATLGGAPTQAGAPGATAPAVPLPSDAAEMPFEANAVLFTRQAEESPRRVAILCEDETLSYRELEERSNRLAHLLIGRGAGPERIVALGIKRSIEMLVAMVAIVKSGAAFLPIDPEYPEQRRAYLMTDAAATLYVTRELFDAPELAAMPATPPAVDILPDMIAYVIYTSGSTGWPKGVVVTQRAAANLYRWYADRYNLVEGRRVLVVSSYAFDLTLKNLLAPLLYGGTVVLAHPGIIDGRELRRLIERHRIELVNCTPSQFYPLLEDRAALPMGLELAILGGEPIRNALLRPIGERNAACRFVNSYGPTECTDVAIDGFVTRPGDPEARVALGAPIDGMSAHLFDAALAEVQSGEVGELCLGGIGVGRGYLHRPALTAERFVPDPAGGGRRIFRTGDLVRRDEEGALQFVGRADDQVKVRGFRIELGEIEAALQRHPEVERAVVVTDGARLGAYYAAARALSTAELENHLGRLLPSHMVGVVFERRDQWPMTPSGKLDRTALTMPAIVREARSARPLDPLESIVADAFSRHLDVPDIGPDDGFFALGGHSLLAMSVVAELRERLDHDIPIHLLFEAPTVAGFAAALAAAGVPSPVDEGRPTADQGGSGPDEYLLSFAQERMWFLEQFGTLGSAYNVPIVTRLQGPLDVAALGRALDALIARHEVLRTRFTMTAGSARQVIGPPWPAGLVAEPVAPDAVDAAVAETLAVHIDLTAGTPLVARLLRVALEQHVLVLVIHHIATDAWSNEILVRDLGALYEAECGGAAVLPKPGARYLDWARCQRELLTPERLAELLAWWREHLRGAPSRTALPLDRPRPMTPSHRGARAAVHLDPHVVERLKAIGRGLDATPFMTIFALFAWQLSEWTGERDLVIGTPLANRAQRDVENTVGLFLNTLALRFDLRSARTFADVVRRVRDAAIGGYAAQELPFERLVEYLRPERDRTIHPIFQTMFVLQNQAGQAAAAPRERVISIAPITLTSTTAKFDFAMLLTIGEDGIRGGVEYATDLFDSQTIQRFVDDFTALASLAAEAPDAPLDRSGACDQPSPSSLVTLAPGRGEGTLFCIPPAGGSAAAYLQLAAELASETRIVAFDALALVAGGGALPHTIAGFAAAYLAAFERAGAHEPIHLLGYSVGGTIAFEMACRLRSAGRKVAALVLIDSYIQETTPLSDAALDRIAWEVCASVHLRGGEAERAFLAALEREERGSRPAALMHASIREAGTQRMALRDIERMHTVTRALVKAGRGWRPDDYADAVDLIVATRARAEPLGNTVAQWRAHAPRLVAHEVPARHLELLDAAFLPQIGRIVAAALARPVDDPDRSAEAADVRDGGGDWR